MIPMTELEHPYPHIRQEALFAIPQEVFLHTRICDLPVELENTGIDHYAQKLGAELTRVGLESLELNFYLADEWFCPEGTTHIAVPFWLANPKLKRIEKKIMGYVEGGTARTFMQLLRHEVGHCMDHAYRLSQRSDWQKIFGDPKIDYNPDHYQWDSRSQDYVKHLPDGYAQSHPEEDWAETFAVWLDPQSQWQQRYHTWKGALRKLEFVEKLMKKIKNGSIKKVKTKSHCIAEQRRLRMTLEQFYKRRQRQVGLVQKTIRH
jgi:hypothetical protein